MPLTPTRGDLFAPPLHPALAHGCNCASAMGAGVSVQFREHLSDKYEAYRRECLVGRFKPGFICEHFQPGAPLTPSPNPSPHNHFPASHKKSKHPP